MKKQLLLALFMGLLSAANSQVFSFSVPIGASTLKAPVIGAQGQIAIGHWILASGFDHQIGQKVERGTYFWGRTGAALWLSELNSIELTAGFGQYRKSSTNKELNKGISHINAQYVHELANRPDGAIFGSITATKEFVLFTGGIRYTFRFLLKSNFGCPSSNVR